MRQYHIFFKALEESLVKQSPFHPCACLTAIRQLAPSDLQTHVLILAARAPAGDVLAQPKDAGTRNQSIKNPRNA